MKQRNRVSRLVLMTFVLMLINSSIASINSPRNVLAQETYISIGEPPVPGASAPTAPDGGAIELAAGSSVDPSTRRASRDFFLNHFTSQLPAVGWNGSLDSCNAGSQSAAYRQAILNQIAYYRAMAGVPSNISLSSTYNQKAQHAALIMAANQSLSHTPTSAWDCYSAAGYEGASSSNIYLQLGGSQMNPPDPVTAYMDDRGGNNAPVGHRRWLLYPQTQTFGTGDVSHTLPPENPEWPEFSTRISTNAIWVFDGRYSYPRPTTRDDFVAWPPKGYTPWFLFFDRFSFSWPGASFASANVSVRIGSSDVPTSVESRTVSGMGENTIVWSLGALPGSVTWPPGPDVTFTITVSNVMINGSPRTFTYDATAFDPYTGGPSAELSTDRGTVGNTIDFELTEFPPNKLVTAKWQRPTGTVDTLPATVTTNGDGEATGSFVVPAVPGGTGHRVLFEAAGGGTASASFELVPRVVITPVPVGRGETITISLRGFGRQELVSVRWRQPNGAFEQIASVTTSNSGSANVTGVTPVWALDGLHVVRAEGASLNAQTNTVQVLGGLSGAPSASIAPAASTVNNWITYTIENFPALSPVSLSWTRLSGGSIDLGVVQTDASGAASGQFRVPATPGGPNQAITFRSGNASAIARFEVKPRIKVNTSPAIRGQAADVSLRGYARQEEVRIRWFNPTTGAWVELARVNASNTGSVNVNVIVPAFAPDGMNAVRGDGTTFRQQTNTVLVQAPPVSASEEESATPIESPTPHETETPLSDAAPTPIPTETPESTPTEEPTAPPPSPTEEVPTESPTSTPESSQEAGS